MSGGFSGFGEADGTRTRNPQIDSLDAQRRKELSDKPLDAPPAGVLASCLPKIRQNQPDLASVMASWDSLPKAVKAGILAMVEAVPHGEGC